ncbi:MAG: hypothetical protein A3C43_11460 [Candidatus Schekmanbacteria bacterium RIFCSPHIGHO2_02_FULL_38_11]|uniref:Uncharacterized protein n=1 Tax=Candidatus Schekmanbacteria bacterium RIFCSPLOWO2_12_FULL_38_15 TaxID=1817883 RepID=A0A1F7SJV7_9BACT|nr:MAG: hypothetical protein A2043_05040 [Candidatus Schekmanbacteria bacterium GWA2_38_9]OGL51739.1 MAG: hypothetical protein A3H37_11880 [Candidatus Schekmanbacteria bacterium RIFCSPLOWO2_02_FULL_38_14]OGL52406.1 MAG: hypothetical protein A3C43_11460 [Candidatus Schekmanbacteria bacterium RIFCSPHIGHO2_02_FULL_38_11]OGL54062.1 MAG: hypothetical protein A3G31_04355 [Candidatus Schekmanbacteria bacterium RIFCSPLOWO2_12_FULL_38_15]
MREIPCNLSSPCFRTGYSECRNTPLKEHERISCCKKSGYQLSNHTKRGFSTLLFYIEFILAFTFDS